MHDLSKFFVEKFEDLPCDENTKAYIVSIFGKYKTSTYDLSKRSITLHFSEARDKQDFLMFQTIAEWIFFCNSIFPEYLNNASIDYYYSIGQLSFYTCYRMLNRQLKIYEEMSDQFVPLSLSVREIIRTR